MPKQAHSIIQYYENGIDYLEIVLCDGSSIKYSLGNSYFSLNLPKIPKQTAKLIREYAHGSITYEHLLDANGITRPADPVEKVAEEISTHVERLVRSQEKKAARQENIPLAGVLWNPVGNTLEVAFPDDSVSVFKIDKNTLVKVVLDEPAPWGHEDPCWEDQDSNDAYVVKDGLIVEAARFDEFCQSEVNVRQNATTSKCCCHRKEDNGS